jgi:hypothetical protein
VGPEVIKPTTHGLRVRPSNSTLGQSKAIYPQAAVRPNLFGMDLTQLSFIFPVPKLFGKSNSSKESINKNDVTITK